MKNFLFKLIYKPKALLKAAQLKYYKEPEWNLIVVRRCLSLYTYRDEVLQTLIDNAEIEISKLAKLEPSRRSLEEIYQINTLLNIQILLQINLEKRK